MCLFHLHNCSTIRSLKGIIRMCHFLYNNQYTTLVPPKSPEFTDLQCPTEFPIPPEPHRSGASATPDSFVPNPRYREETPSHNKIHEKYTIRCCASNEVIGCALPGKGLESEVFKIGSGFGRWAEVDLTSMIEDHNPVEKVVDTPPPPARPRLTKVVWLRTFFATLTLHEVQGDTCVEPTC